MYKRQTRNYSIGFSLNRPAFVIIISRCPSASFNVLLFWIRWNFNKLKTHDLHLVWMIEAVVCLLAANRGSSCSLTRAMDDRIVRCGIISSCQSAATSEIVKTLLATSSSHVRSAIASTGLYLYLCLDRAGIWRWWTCSLQRPAVPATQPPIACPLVSQRLKSLCIYHDTCRGTRARMTF